MGAFSETKQAPPADVITTPETGYSFVSPYMEDYSRRLLGSYFGSPGEYEGLISRPRDIPIEQTAGLTPLQIQARQQAGQLGDFQGQLDQAGGLFGQQRERLDSAFDYLPKAEGAIQGGLGVQTEAQQRLRDADRFLPQAERFIGQGADTIQGGLGALGRAEQSAMGATGMYDPSQAQSFFNPYEDQVVQQTLEDINRQSAQADIGLRDRAISQGAFGGSRGRISQEELARQTGRGASEAVAGIRSAGFGQAQNQAQQAFESQRGAQQGLASMQAGLGAQQAQIGSQQAGLGSQMAGLGQQQIGSAQALSGLGSSQMAGGQALAGLGSQAGSMGQQYGQIGQGIAGLGLQGQNQLGNQINMLNQLGQQGQATQQAALSRQYAGANQLANEPMNRLMQGQQLLAGSPMGGLSGGTGTSAYQRGVYQEPTGLGQLVGAAGTIMTGIGAMKSDVDLKTNIKKVGELEPNIGWYTWDWNDKGKAIGAESEPSEGVLAQEVLEVKPDAVIVKDGYYAVDYSKVL